MHFSSVRQAWRKQSHGRWTVSRIITWSTPDIVIDVVRGRGGMLSLDNGRERRFLVRSDMCALPATTG